MIHGIKRLVLILGIASTCLTQAAPKKAVIFDIGNVLVGSAKREAFQVTGPAYFAWYFASNPCMIPASTEKIRCQVLYPFLRNCLPNDPHSCPMYDEFGQRMPQIMVEWMTGRMNCALLRAICREKAALYSSWFASETEKNLARALTTVIFTPAYLVHTQKLLQKSVDFVRACKQAGYSIYILSNWDPESFPELVKKDPAFFDLFDGIVISGYCGYVKPDPNIYEYMLTTYQLDADTCFFIDDVLPNVEAARAAGITAAHCLHGDIDTIKPAFDQWQKNGLSQV